MESKRLEKKISGRGSEKKSIDLFQDVLADLEDEGLVHNLCASMPRRIQKCIENEGGPTKY